MLLIIKEKKTVHVRTFRYLLSISSFIFLDQYQFGALNLRNEDDKGDIIIFFFFFFFFLFKDLPQGCGCEY